MPIMEAMACGCPVLTSDRFGTKEISGNAALLVDPESVDAIAAGIDRLLNDRELRAANIAAGLERSSQFTWTHTAAELLRVLESL
ncbi:glycosyltransferase [Steroidobacter cummioxidans]|uniref:glycosyltransferase n=1 Tax=Steroidobacter cummioxidans TaxID=1803913 RepID=UPI0039C9DD38